MKSEFSGSATSVANPPVNPCDLSSVDGPGAGGRAPAAAAEGAQLAFEH